MIEGEHKWNGEFCSCGQDCVTCQITGKRICGNLTVHLDGIGNVSLSHVLVTQSPSRATVRILPRQLAELAPSF